MTSLQEKAAKAIVNVFETGRVQGDYGSVTLLQGDSGHLTYGRSQTTLGSGNLFLLIKAYCEAPGAQFAAALEAYLPKLAAKDVTLDQDMTLRGILHSAGADPVMRSEQDAFFARAYFQPACHAAQAFNLDKPLAQTVVYDSFIQGGWKTISDMVTRKLGPVGPGVAQEQWIRTYVETRKQWLSSLKPPLPKTTYRMDSFLALLDAGGASWDLTLPFTVHGVTIDETSLGDEPAAPVVVRASASQTQLPVLQLTNPYTTGEDVRKLQQALVQHGFTNKCDGIYGPFTAALVTQFQRASGLHPDGIAASQTLELLNV